MILRIRVCIPTFNNPKTIVGVVRGVLKETPFPLLIVDDGSETAVQKLLEAAGVFPDDRITVLRFETNQGKGAALQAAFRDCAAKGFTHMAAIDGDGQHFPEEIPKLARAAKENPWNVIVGSRAFQGPNVPEISRFGRKFSNFWVKFQTDFKVGDSQSGFRLYPIFFVQNMVFFTRRFDFEIEVLIRLLWKGVGVSELEVKCHYPPPHERVSHFKKFSDNARISFLNTVFVILSLLRMKVRPSRAALAVGLGVWIGCTPFIGFHTFIAAAFSFFFRLNFPYLWIGTQISLPPLMPFIITAAITLGKTVIGHSRQAVAGLALDWLVGSLILGAILGVILGALSYAVAKVLQGRAQKGKGAWSGKTRGGRLGNGFLKWVMRALGLRATYFCLYFVVPYFYLFAPKARASMNEYLKIVKPELAWLPRQPQIMRHFLVFAKTLVDRAFQSFKAELQFDACSEGNEEIIRTLQSQKPLVLLGAHVGAWELGALAVRRHGLPVSFTVLRFEAEGLTFRKVAPDREPDNRGVRTVYTNLSENPLLKIREILSSGSPVGMMGDRPAGNHFELLPFFGRIAPFDMTPYRLAAACGAELAFSFGFKESARAYRFFLSSPKAYAFDPDRDKALQCAVWAHAYVQALEEHLRKNPEQWFNFFPFWSSRPISRSGESPTPVPARWLEELSPRTPPEAASEPHPKSTGAPPRQS